jgi:pimeloyl-ACP methyl ester carboxylesterase
VPELRAGSAPAGWDADVSPRGRIAWSTPGPGLAAGEAAHFCFLTYPRPLARTEAGRGGTGLGGPVEVPGQPGRRPVIFVHGIGGCALRDSRGVDAWPYDVVHDWLPGGRGRPENLEFTSVGIPSGGPAAVPREDTESRRLTPRWPLPVGGETMASLIGSLKARGLKVIPFAYDFRYSAAASAAALRRFIGAVLKRTARSRVDIVAHSMGGLVIKRYLAEHPEEPRVGTVVMLGTPHLGAPSAYRTLLVGDDLGASFDLPGGSFDAVSPCLVRRAIHNMPGVYDLLPSRSYLDRLLERGDDSWLEEEEDLDRDGETGPVQDFARQLTLLSLGRFRNEKCRFEPMDREPSPLTLNPALAQVPQ